MKLKDIRDIFYNENYKNLNYKTGNPTKECLFNCDAEKVLKEIKDNQIDFILTDPPYFISKEASIIKRSNEYKYKGKDITLKENWDMIWENKDEYKNWLLNILKEFYRILKENKHCVIFCSQLMSSFLMEEWEKLGGKYRMIIIWEKENPVPAARGVNFVNSFEVAVWLTKGEIKKKEFNWQLGMKRNIIKTAIPKSEGCDIRHPTQKPIFLGLFLISYLSKPEEIVLDPFAGVFTFPLSAYLLNRKYIGIEKDKKYFLAGIKRFTNIIKVYPYYQKFIKFMKETMNEKYKDEFKYLLQLQSLF